MQFTGNILEYFLVFGGGVLVSFTPCVYPILPITASFIAGINTSGSRLQGFLISLLYVLGVAITYCALGLIAALSGKAFGQLQSHPAVYWSVAAILAAFALVMLDVIRIPSFGVAFHHKIQSKTVGTVILFGMAAGLVVGPCLSPVLGSLLAYVATKQNIVHGVSLLFVFSYGVGASLILVGTFVGILESFPKAGKWMTRIKHFCGAVLLVFAGYYIYQALQLMG